MNTIDFIFEQATSAHIPEIINLMKQVKSDMPNKEWFVDDNEAYLHDILNGTGFVLLARSAVESQLAAFFMVKFPGLSEDNLGRHLDFTDNQLEKCVHMDSCVVHANFRGQHLQSKLAKLAEQMLLNTPYTYLLATIHPDNCYSMNSMKRCGYHVIKETQLYGGLPRAILFKKIIQLQ